MTMGYLKKLSKPILVALASGAAMAAAHAAEPVTTLSGACWAKTSGVAVSSVDWPTGSNWTMPLSNVPFEAGYTNNLDVSSDIAFSSGYPDRWSSAQTFSAAMGALNDKALNYMDQRHATNTSGTVTYTFATPLTQNEAMLVLDVDQSEKADITFYDASDNEINYDKVTAVQIRAGATALTIDDLTPTKFGLAGTGSGSANPTWAFSPIGGQTIKKVVVVQGTGNAEGSWDVTFVHATCDPGPQPVATPVPTLDVWALGLLAGLLGVMGFRRRRAP